MAAHRSIRWRCRRQCALGCASLSSRTTGPSRRSGCARNPFLRPTTADLLMEHDDDSFLNRWARRKRESANAARAAAPEPAQPLAALPPINELSFESDFKAFMNAKVD